MGKHVLFGTGIWRLGSKEEGFFYRYPGTDELVREERVLARTEELKVPPAWEDARIARSPSAKVQAIGYDSAGRLQYRYHTKYGERNEREKFERILDFADRLPHLRRVTSGHLKHKHLDREKVLACMTRMMNAAYLGSATSATRRTTRPTASPRSGAST
jgi:DNA topoisomerase-1